MPALPELLRRLPALACEPELAAAEFAPARLQAAELRGLPAPEAIARLADGAFHARVLVQVNALKARARAAGDEALHFLGDAARYYIEAYRGPAWDNPLVVALYYRSLARLEGRPLSAQACLAAARDYEARHGELLQEKWRAWSLLHGREP